MPKKWSTNSHIKKYEYPNFTLWEDSIVPPGGQQRIYAYLEKRPSVMLIAVNERSEYYMVRQYRYPVQEQRWEFPAGGLDEGEDLREAARRELQEEIRFTSSNLTRLGQFNSNSSLTTEKCTVFLAKDLTPASQERDSTEAGMLVKAFRLEEIEEMVRQGEVREGSSLAALTYLKMFLAGQD
jgi:8-oxo-dGTP pyrophosphatase MutT (NUDIX family)